MRSARSTRRRWSIRLGRVAGIDVRVHATLLVFVWLIVVLSADEDTSLLSPLAWMVLLFGSVLVHEVAHSLVARAVGVGVTEIELLPIGGVSKMDRIPDQPRSEVAIAIAGPLTSLGIGAVALGVAATFHAAVWPPDLYEGALLPRLGWLNLILAAFNFIPALPLDGGRVLRAAVEDRVGPTEATHIAARAGRYFAFLLMAVGALVNVWLMIIGVFVYFTGRAEDAGARIHEELGRMTVADVMIRGAIVLPASLSIASAGDLLHTTVQRQFAVVDAFGNYRGLADLDADVPPGATIVDDITEVETPVSSTTPLDELALSARGPATAVVDGTRVVGLVCTSDVVRMANRSLKKEKAA